MKEKDHGAKEKGAESEVLQRVLEVDRFAGEIDYERAGDNQGEIASCEEEIVRSFRLIEIADVIHKTPKEEEKDHLAPEFGHDEKDRLDPIAVNGDPVGVFLS